MNKENSKQNIILLTTCSIATISFVFINSWISKQYVRNQFKDVNSSIKNLKNNFEIEREAYFRAFEVQRNIDRKDFEERIKLYNETITQNYIKKY